MAGKSYDELLAEYRESIPEMDPEQVVVVCLSGRGDKDVAEVSRLLERADPVSEERSS